MKKHLDEAQRVYDGRKIDLGIKPTDTVPDEETQRAIKAVVEQKEQAQVVAQKA